VSFVPQSRALFPRVTVSDSLSALLAEATSDQMYLDAARELADFIHAHLYNIGNVIQDSISAGDCSTTPNAIMPYNSGLTIEGLSILASITKNASTLGL
jgi:predicted alpha-1,6-mannanase (GH76 family)